MMLTIARNKPCDVTFKVSISGTSTKPQQVLVVFNCDGVALSYPAKDIGNEQWTANVVLPDSAELIGDGYVFMSVQVLVNNKLFVPLKNMSVTVEPDLVQMPVVTQPPLPQPPAPVASPVEINPIPYYEEKEPIIIAKAEVKPISMLKLTEEDVRKKEVVHIKKHVEITKQSLRSHASLFKLTKKHIIEK